MTDLYILFGAPPGHHPGSSFIEVEDADGHSLSPQQAGIDWSQRPGGVWALGPFSSPPRDQAGPSQGGVGSVFSESFLLEKIAAAAERLTHAVGPSYVTAYNDLKEAVEELDQLRGEHVDD